MDILNLGDDIFLDFAINLDKDNITKENSEIIRKKNYVKLISNPHMSESGNVFDIQREITFTHNLCFFEYCCLRLDFSTEWQNYLQNIKEKTSQCSL